MTTFLGCFALEADFVAGVDVSLVGVEADMVYDACGIVDVEVMMELGG